MNGFDAWWASEGRHLDEGWFLQDALEKAYQAGFERGVIAGVEMSLAVVKRAVQARVEGLTAVKQAIQARLEAET